MTQIFVSGSRSVHFLPIDAINALNRIVEQKFGVLVGDCDGADTAVQRYLKTINYQNVIVCHIGPSPRHNLGFNTLPIEGYYQTDKDEYMGHKADYGLAIWDGQSQGTSRNIQRVKTKTVPARANKATCIICQSPSENGSIRLPITFHELSNPRIPVCISCYRSGQLKTEMELRGFSC